MRISPAAVLLAAASAFSAGCESVRPDVCGAFPPGGGPPVVSTRDQEACELARLRVRDAVAAAGFGDARRIEVVHDLSRSWDDARTVDGLVARVRQDAGDAVADAVRRACDDVAAHSKRPDAPGCGEACLVRGAAKGARIALDDALDFAIRTNGPFFDPKGKVERGD